MSGVGLYRPVQNYYFHAWQDCVNLRVMMALDEPIWFDWKSYHYSIECYILFLTDITYTRVVVEPVTLFFNFFKTNFKSNTVAFLFSNLTCLAVPKSLVWPKHAVAPHASARHGLPQWTTIFTRKTLPRHSHGRGNTVAPRQSDWHGKT